MSDDTKLFGKAGRQRAIAPTLSPRHQTLLLNVLKTKLAPNFSEALRQLSREWIDDGPSVELRATLLLVADLWEQGWRFNVDDGERMVFEPPGLARDEGESVEAV